MAEPIGSRRCDVFEPLTGIQPSLQRLLDAQRAFNAAVAETSAMLALLCQDELALMSRLVAVGWDRDAAEEYVWSLPKGVAWLMPTPRPAVFPSD